MPEIDGSKWRLRARHPRRDMPLRVTNKAGKEIGKPGQTCEDMAPEILASLLRNDFIESVPVSPIDGMAVPEAKDVIAEADAEALDVIEEAEAAGKARVGVQSAIEARRAELTEED